ncbi:GNAT family N-acetyltransferase [Pendulispora rubella]|uniref:GNAT family N-acetyltransferase n=1 Tax=Pendulispora rubella TaxID=2741070 RepID=A0ABZ2KYT2_9BACT
MLGGSEDVVVREIVEGPRRALVHLPDMRRIERPGWFQLITPSFRQGGFNEVACSELAENEADAIIEATVGEYRRLGIKFRWLVGARTQPADLGSRLERAGLIRYTSCAMFVETPHPEVPFAAEKVSTADEVSIEEVDDAGLDLYTRVMATGWNVEAGPLENVHRRMMQEKERSQRFFLGRYQGRPAAAAGYLDLGRSAYLLGAVVLPDFRRHSLYRAIVAARLRDARARGLRLATSLARAETSAPILERMGFRTAERLSTYSG